MARILLLLLALSALAFAPAPLPKKERHAPAAPLEGLWEGGSGPTWKVKITGTQMIYYPPGVPNETACNLAVYPKASPPAYDTTAGGTRWSGIFRLEGDKLTLCYLHGDKRPTSFDGAGGAQYEVYRRVKS